MRQRGRGVVYVGLPVACFARDARSRRTFLGLQCGVKAEVSDGATDAPVWRADYRDERLAPARWSTARSKNGAQDGGGWRDRLGRSKREPGVMVLVHGDRRAAAARRRYDPYGATAGWCASEDRRPQSRCPRSRRNDPNAALRLMAGPRGWRHRTASLATTALMKAPTLSRSKPVPPFRDPVGSLRTRRGRVRGSRRRRRW